MYLAPPPLSHSLKRGRSSKTWGGAPRFAPMSAGFSRCAESMYPAIMPPRRIHPACALARRALADSGSKSRATTSSLSLATWGATRIHARNASALRHARCFEAKPGTLSGRPEKAEEGGERGRKIRMAEVWCRRDGRRPAHPHVKVSEREEEEGSGWRRGRDGGRGHRRGGGGARGGESREGKKQKIDRRVRRGIALCDSKKEHHGRTGNGFEARDVTERDDPDAQQRRRQRGLQYVSLPAKNKCDDSPPPSVLATDLCMFSRINCRLSSDVMAFSTGSTRCPSNTNLAESGWSYLCLSAVNSSTEGVLQLPLVFTCKF
ncbi:hypothetical protein B0H13DRAFT_1853149 [Mycena leptocephala]|nr:hypothetical protein B0H13DRAFT_1853149 [Mycena leptocephala]